MNLADILKCEFEGKTIQQIEAPFLAFSNESRRALIIRFSDDTVLVGVCDEIIAHRNHERSDVWRAQSLARGESAITQTACCSIEWVKT